MQAWSDENENMIEDCERHVFHRITCEGYEMKECVHGGKERELRNNILLPTLFGSYT